MVTAPAMGQTWRPSFSVWPEEEVMRVIKEVMSQKRVRFVSTREIWCLLSGKMPGSKGTLSLDFWGTFLVENSIHVFSEMDRNPPHKVF